MATFEERLTAIEQEHAELKHENADLKEKIDLHTLALSGMVNKGKLDQINAQNDKIFQALQNHDQFISMQLSELREKMEQVDGKIIGVQTEMRQGFSEIKLLLNTLTNKPDQQQ